MQILNFFAIGLGIMQIVQATLDDECTDTSYYKPIEWVNSNDTCCTTKIIEPLCKVTPKQVCVELEERECEVVSWSDCTMSDCPVQVTEPEQKPETYKPWECEQKDLIKYHEKERPLCKNETKRNCDTLWAIDKDGKKVWAGESNCEEVVWENCNYKEKYQAEFVTKQSECVYGQEIVYDKCINKTTSNNQMCLDCVARAEPKCKTVKRTECVTVQEKKCQPQTKEECNFVPKEPIQEFVHQQKCLLGNENQGAFIPRT